MPKIYTGIGSRETPEDILALMRQAGDVLCRLGWLLRSGGARGADHAFYAGCRASPHFTVQSANIYISWNGMKGQDDIRLYHSPLEGIYDATLYETWEEARTIASGVHGAFEKCGQGGQMLHTRNVFQILGHTLVDPTKFVLFWAKPVGKLGYVKGGTNTAIQLARQHHIDTINLYTDEGRLRLETFLSKAA